MPWYYSVWSLHFCLNANFNHIDALTLKQLEDATLSDLMSLYYCSIKLDYTVILLELTNDYIYLAKNETNTKITCISLFFLGKVVSFWEMGSATRKVTRITRESHSNSSESYSVILFQDIEALKYSYGDTLTKKWTTRM